MREFILASGNLHKAEEFGELFDPEVIKIIPAVKTIDIDECGSSFHENALIKARSYYQSIGRPTLADDSGLIVPALPDELGIYSARFGGEELGYKEKNKLLLSKLDGKSREAYFACILCFYMSEAEYFFFEGRLLGEIALEPKGASGFGYDPVFIPNKLENGNTLAMEPDWKQMNSHRASAAQQASKFFSDC